MINLLRRISLLSLFVMSCAAPTKGARSANGGADVEEVRDIDVRATMALEAQCWDENAAACDALGMRRLEGRGADQDALAAQTSFDRACELGDSAGCWHAGMMREKGVGVPVDLPGALEQFQKACGDRLVQACTNTLRLQARMVGTAATALTDWVETCEAGDPLACFNVAFQFERGKNGAKAAEFYEKSCGGGYAKACNSLGVLYRHGVGIPQDERRGAELYERACEGGFAAACNNLGTVYLVGSGVDPDAERARTHYRQSCEMRFARGCTNLGIGLLDIDAAAARDALRRGCERGDARGCVRLGVLYLQGADGIEAQPAEAVTLFKRACERGDGSGCTNLGVVYESGEDGVDRDVAAAERSYRMACDLNEPQGCHNLGLLFESGLLGEPDPGEAADQFMRACEKGLPYSCAYLGAKWAQSEERRDFGLELLDRACAEGDTFGCNERARY